MVIETEELVDGTHVELEWRKHCGGPGSGEGFAFVHLAPVPSEPLMSYSKHESKPYPYRDKAKAIKAFRAYVRKQRKLLGSR